MLNIGLFRFSLSLDPCFLPFYTTIALQILYTTNFLIENVFYLLVKRRDLSNERNTSTSKTRTNLKPARSTRPIPKKKDLCTHSYKADPEKKTASVRDSYKADPEKKKASVRDNYNADIESKQSAKRWRWEEDLEENRAAKRQKYEDNSAAIKASERSDPAVRLAAERMRSRRGHITTTTTQRYVMVCCINIKKLCMQHLYSPTMYSTKPFTSHVKHAW